MSWSLALLASRHAFDTYGTCGPPKNSLPVHINRAHQKRCESTEVYLAEPTTKVQLVQAACIEEPRRTRLMHPYRLSENSQHTHYSLTPSSPEIMLPQRRLSVDGARRQSRHACLALPNKSCLLSLSTLSQKLAIMLAIT